VKISIIVCTRDRCTRLKALLSSLADAHGASSMDLDLIVVDDGSSDGTAVAVKQFGSIADFPVRLLQQQPGRGLAAARNRGLREAYGDLLIFLDDDCVVSRNYFREVVARFAADHEPVLRGGRVELGDPLDAPITIKTSPDVERLAACGDPGGFILGCNMTMTRAVACKIGPFDERFGAGGLMRAGEDTDYLVRALLANVTVEYVPDMTVYHHHGRRSLKAVVGVHRNYGIGNGALTIKHARHAPWLWRSRYWMLRNAIRERFGGPPFDAEMGLTHAPIVAHHLIGAYLFVLAKLRRAPPWPADLEWMKPLASLELRQRRPLAPLRNPDAREAASTGDFAP
jgi:glycosyltransferase involved in cell wall biosynthesis